MSEAPASVLVPFPTREIDLKDLTLSCDADCPSASSRNFSVRQRLSLPNSESEPPFDP